MSIVCASASYSYEGRDTLALSNISFSLNAGELLVVAGESGSGKSTLLRLISGLARPQQGVIEIDGEPPEAGRIGYAFQNPDSQLFADTVLDDVMFGPRNQGLSEEKARIKASAVLDMVGVGPDLAHISPFRLSGGTKRRVAIAGVLALDSSTYLFDEPLAGLDGRGIGFMLDLLKGLKANDKHVIVVTHDLETLLSEADRILLLDAGRVAWVGTTVQIMSSADPFTSAGLLPPVDLQFMTEHARLTSLNEEM